MTPPPFQGSVLFSPLPRWKTPWSELFFSYGVQVAIIAIFFWVPILTPQVLESRKDYHAIELVPTPVPENHEAQRELPGHALMGKVEQVDPPPAAVRLEAPVPRVKARVENAPAPEVKISTHKLDPVPTPVTPVIPKQTVRTNLFSTGSSASQTIRRPAQQVQTGGFGDPNGVPAKTAEVRAVNIAQAGGFDMPAGAGVGNGTSGANGVRGVVASAGFGSSMAKVATRPTGEAVRDAGFGNSGVPAPPTVQSRPAQPAAATLVPAEILAKPVPVYTSEAKAQKIEGEVLLEVVFEASGKLRVLKIVRGLGHGLDDAAVRAAEQIRFKPALRDGQPSDSTAVVHIIFQLA